MTILPLYKKRYLSFFSFMLAFLILQNLFLTNFVKATSKDKFFEQSITTSDIKKKKNVILIVFDGFGLGTLNFLVLNHVFGNGDHAAFLDFTNQSNFAFSMTSAYKTVITDSAASGSAIATGSKTNNKSVGVGPYKKKLTSISEILKAKDKSIGIVTSSRITHATPGAFYGHVIDRNNESSLAEQLSQKLLNGKVDIALGGGLSFFLPKNLSQKELNNYPDFFKTSSRDDNLNLIDKLKKNNVHVIFNKNELNKLRSKKDSHPVLGLFSQSHIPYAIDRENIPAEAYSPSVDEMASSALSVLQKNKKNGFFLMVESSHVDLTQHNGDMGALTYELKDASRLIKLVKNFVDKNPDTIAILTADHETGGIGINYFDSFKEDYMSGDVKLKNKILQNLLGTRYYHVKEDLKKLWNTQKISLKSLFKQVINFKKPIKEETYAVDTKKLQYLINQNFPIELSINEVKRVFSINGRNQIYMPDIYKKYPTIFRLHGGKKYKDGFLYAIFVHQVLSHHFGITWNSGTHLAGLVPTFVYTKDQEEVLTKKWIQNTDIFQIMANVTH